MSPTLIHELIVALWQTIYMVVISSFIAAIVGIPLGIVLETRRANGILENISIYRALTIIINGFRSIPFIILMIAIVPFTHFIVGTSIGTTAAIVPLTIGAIPFMARLTETALAEVPKGLIEAGYAMGASPRQIIRKIYIPEAFPGIIKAITLTTVTLVAYSAMAGAVGGGGLGDLAIRYGYQRFEINIMLATIAILIILVQLLQWIGDRTAHYFLHRS